MSKNAFKKFMKSKYRIQSLPPKHRKYITEGSGTSSRISREVTIVSGVEESHKVTEHGMTTTFYKPLGERRVVQIDPCCTLPLHEIAKNYGGIIFRSSSSNK